ncbi:hypothetical protein [Streptomyces sp. NPDC001815]|uniref:hypothetical protein n=1 Tax=Streptomyces sp. NPDC001815 TaxID=3154526 RepID=UPI0033260588
MRSAGYARRPPVRTGTERPCEGDGEQPLAVTAVRGEPAGRAQQGPGVALVRPAEQPVGQF